MRTARRIALVRAGGGLSVTLSTQSNRRARHDTNDGKGRARPASTENNRSVERDVVTAFATRVVTTD